MSEKTREVAKLADATSAHTLVMSTFDNQSMFINIYCCKSKLCWQVGAPLWFSPTLPLKYYFSSS